MTITVRTIWLVMPVLLAFLAAYGYAGWWIMTRWVDPWLRRRLGLPPKDRP